MIQADQESFLWVRTLVHLARGGRVLKTSVIAWFSSTG